jgi:hypothetical protein
MFSWFQLGFQLLTSFDGFEGGGGLAVVVVVVVVVVVGAL